MKYAADLRCIVKFRDKFVYMALNIMVNFVMSMIDTTVQFHIYLFAHTVVLPCESSILDCLCHCYEQIY